MVGGLDHDAVPALIRDYQSLSSSPETVSPTTTRPARPAWRAGQLWFQNEAGPAPLVLTLPGSPPLTREQFGFVAYQQLYVPELAGLLPRYNIGIDSEWPIDKEAAEALVGNQILDGALQAKLVDVRPPAEGRTSRTPSSLSAAGCNCSTA